MLLTVVAFAGCFQKPVEPVAPSWDVGLTAPVTRKSYSLGELSEREPSLFLTTPGTGEMVFQSSGSAPSVMLGDLLSLRPMDASGSAGLGPVAIAPFQQTLPVQVPGLTAGAPVPPIAAVPLPSVDVNIPGFQSVTMEGGTLELRLENHLPADITLEAPIALRDSSGTVVCSFLFSPGVIPAGQARSATAPVNGATLTSRSSIGGAVVSTPGSPAPVAAGDHITATLRGDGLLVSRAVLAPIPPQTLLDAASVTLPLTDSTRIAHIRIGSGTMTLDASSAVGIPIVMRFRFEDLYAASGERFTDSVSLPPFGTGSRTIPLSGMVLRSPDGSLLTGLRFVSTVVMQSGSGGSPVTLSRDDQFSYRVRTSPVVLDSIIGILKPTAVPIDAGIALDWGDLSGKFRASMLLPSAALEFVPRTSTAMPLLMDLRLEALRPDGGGTAVLPFPAGAFKTDGGPVAFDPADVGMFLAEIVADLPPTVRLAGSVVLNPYYDTARRLAVGRNTGVAGDINLEVPLTLAIRAGAALDTTVLGDTTSDGTVDRWIDEGTLRSLNGGQVTIDVENALPLSFALKFSLLDNSGNPLLDLPGAAADSIRVAAATMTGGRVVSPSRSRVVLDLQADDVRRLNPARFLRFSVNLQTPEGRLVTFRAADRLGIRSWAQFSYTVEP